MIARDGDEEGSLLMQSGFRIRVPLAFPSCGGEMFPVVGRWTRVGWVVCGRVHQRRLKRLLGCPGESGASVDRFLNSRRGEGLSCDYPSHSKRLAGGNTCARIAGAAVIWSHDVARPTRGVRLSVAFPPTGADMETPPGRYCVGE